jgi:hypothetical protein
MTLEGLSTSKMGKIVVKLVKESPDGGKSSLSINFLSAAFYLPKWQSFPACGKHATKGSSDVRNGSTDPALIDLSVSLVFPLYRTLSGDNVFLITTLFHSAIKDMASKIEASWRKLVLAGKNGNSADKDVKEAQGT